MNKWTDNEKDFIIEEFKKGNSIEDIFNMGKINRSKFAIECKLYGHIYDLLQNGNTHDELAKTFNQSKKEIKAIESKVFEMRNKSDIKTMYTNDDGYKYQETNNILDLNDFYHVNRTMNTLLNYYENIERLNKLKLSNTIDEEFYNQLINKLSNNLKILTSEKQQQQIINSIDIINIKDNNVTKTNKNEELLSEQNNNKTEKKENIEKNIEKKSYKKDDDESVYTKKIRKRMI